MDKEEITTLLKRVEEMAASLYHISVALNKIVDGVEEK